MNKHRFALLMTVGAYPAVLALLHLMPRSLLAQPHWVKAAFMVPIMVAWMFYVVSPSIQRFFGAWIRPRA
jgi:antibiotic biosynthesis monooxygenase (ABM) superfamily enzyme